MTVDVLAVMLGLLVVAVAGDQFVLAASRVARGLDMRASVIGALVGGVGTSVPQLLVTGFAASHGAVQIAEGSAVGSVIANVALALGIAALVAPVRVDSMTIRREAPISVASVGVFALVLWRGLSLAIGFVLVAVMFAAVVVVLATAGRASRSEELEVEVERLVGNPTRQHSTTEVVRLVLGLTAMVAAADPLVRGAEGVAHHLNIAQGVIGLTMVAIGTSAPLIASSIQAARRGNHDIVVGNVLGGNLFIALGSGAIIAFIDPHASTGQNLGALALMVAIVVAAWAFTARGNVLTRRDASLLLLTYLAALPLISR